jgi:hypothetical protein
MVGISRDLRTIVRFAATGAVVASVVAALFLAYLKSDPPDNWTTIGAALVAVVLCPGFIPFGWAAGVEMELPSLWVIWLTGTVINFALYGVLGAAYVKLRNWREETNTT